MRSFLTLILLLLIPQALFAKTDFSTKPAVQKFIHEMVTKHHFKEKELVKLFSSVKARPSTLKQIKAPLEKQPWFIYRILFVTRGRVHDGLDFWKRNQKILTQAEKKYHIPAGIIVATIGIETKYGKNVGRYRVIDALTNIAFSDSPRAGFFKYELEEFLLLTREQHLDPYILKGSYAGAIGQLQFMPDSYRLYAVSAKKGKQPDLYHNEADIILSVANYYSRHGWKPDQPIAKRISQQLSKKSKTRVVELQNYFSKEYWKTYPNFDVIKRYNTSDLYVMAVYQLSNQIKDLKGKAHNG
ncbi:MAG: lytic murein transglycosylase [Gammaproteobacteria bacterium]|nr:lytic murein transglycosylase [Gammaproteobacteria bacterium]